MVDYDANKIYSYRAWLVPVELLKWCIEQQDIVDANAEGDFDALFKLLAKGLLSLEFERNHVKISENLLGIFKRQLELFGYNSIFHFLTKVLTGKETLINPLVEPVYDLSDLLHPPKNPVNNPLEILSSVQLLWWMEVSRFYSPKIKGNV